jgi:rubrerythrin
MPSEYAAELYVDAMAIEREAAERYAELAARMDKDGNFPVAALFRMLAMLEAKHLEELERRTVGMDLPPLDADYSWCDSEAPETVGRQLVARGITQQRALAIALQAEKRARAFFEQAARVVQDPEVRALAHEMAAEEAGHELLLQRMLMRMPCAELDWRSAL